MKLLALEGHAPGTEYTLGSRAFTVGRSASASLVLDDDDVSREHCRIRPTEDGYVIEDLNSRNGTLVNGLRIEQPTHLEPGDLVIVGRALFEVRATRAPARPPTPSPSRRQPSSHSARPPDSPSARPAAAHQSHVPAASPSRASVAGPAGGGIAAVAEDAAMAGREVHRRIETLAQRLERFETASGGALPALRYAARVGSRSEAHRLLGVCALAAGDRGAPHLVETLGAEAQALHRLVSLALALHEAIGV